MLSLIIVPTGFIGRASHHETVSGGGGNVFQLPQALRLSIINHNKALIRIPIAIVVRTVANLEGCWIYVHVCIVAIR